RRDLAPHRHEVDGRQVLHVLARVPVALGRALVVVERDAGRDHVHQREALVRERGLEDGHQVLLVAREAARDERRAQRERQQHRVDRRQFVDITALRLRAHVRRRGELALGQAVDAVVLDDVADVQVAADRVAHLPEADGERVAVSRDADVDEAAVRRVGAGRNGGHAAVYRVEAVGLAEEVRGRLGRAADAAELRGPVRLDVQLEERLYDRCGDGVVPTARAERGHRALVVAAREPELVGGQAGVPDRWLGNGRHALTPPSWRNTPSSTWWALSGKRPA